MSKTDSNPNLAKEEDFEDETMEDEEDKLAPKSVTAAKKANSLKRSLMMNAFVKVKANGIKKSKPSKEVKEESVAEASAPDDTNLNGENYFNFRKFFSRFIATLQIASSRSGGRSKFEVSEERLQEWKKRLEDGKVPGVVGIRNHGNTCFINAILQCVSYTDLLAEYFVFDQYKSDLKRKRRIAHLAAFHKRNGTSGNKGEVTEQLAVLLKSMWSLQYDPEISIRFKSLVEKHASQYKGSSQHDAQEFLLWLLNQVHDDLNVATKRKYKAAKGTNAERSDDQLAAEALANYMRCNNSFVMDVFQAQFRSSLTCPTCERQSNTFDPFLCVSLPIPQTQKMPVLVTVLYIDQSPRQVRLGLTVGIHETIADLRLTLAKDTGVDQSQILLTEIGALGFRRTFRDCESVQVLKECKDMLYCIETPKLHLAADDDDEDGAHVVLTWVNIFKEGKIEKRFGSPYTIQVSREVLYTDLQKLLMKEMAPILHDDILIANQKVPLFKIKVIDGFDEAHTSTSYLDSQVDLPMYVEAVEQALNLASVEPGAGPSHVKLVLEWDMPAKSQIINDDSDVIEEHSSVKEVSAVHDDSTTVSLQECFELYTSAERLGQGDAWFCPACNRKQEVVKRMGLWSLPDVLVIHLKRFKQSSASNSANKLSTMVECPLEGFDMTPNVAKPNASSPTSPPDTGVPPPSGGAESNGHTLKMLNAFSPWKNPKRFTGSRGHDCVYDLYAVCNHHGGDLQGGHYTASCRNPTDGQWYNFDDMHTKSIEIKDVVTQDAYILFYQKQSLSASSAASASSSSSSGSSTQEHWVFRMPDFAYKKKTDSKKPGAFKIYSPKKTKIEETEKKNPSTTTKTSPFDRSSKKYSTMPVKKSSTEVEVDDQGAQSDIEPDLDEDNTSEEGTVAAEDKSIKSVNADTDDSEVSRPIDQNDVD